MAFKVTIETKFKIPEAIKEIEGAASGMLEGSANVVRDATKMAVRPGYGPGPHPHRTPHIDTGDLMRDIQTGEEYKEGDALVREVGNMEATYYGSILELGWYSRGAASRFYRYPWLWPALLSSIGDIRQRISSVKL